MRVLSYGEILWDIIDGKHYLGGAPFNFAAHFARWGAESYMISRLGNDDLGERALNDMKKLNVQTEFLQFDSRYPTGTVEVSLENGQPSYHIKQHVAYDYIDLDELFQDGIDDEIFDVFGFGTLAQRNTTSRDSLMGLLDEVEFKHVFFDVNLRQNFYSLPIIKDSLAFSNILKLNDEEVTVIGELIYGEKLKLEEFCQKIFADYHQKIIIITAGGEGCYIYYKSQLHQVPGEKINVVDTVGAGDSFSAAFLASYFRKGNPVLAASIANQVGAFVASSQGPIPKYSDKIQALIET